MATRTCDGRLFDGAGVNLKSVSDALLPAKAAASRGSAVAGVKVETGSKLTATAGARFFDCAPARAGVSTRPAAANAVTVLANFDRPRCNTKVNSLFTTRYSYRDLKVPCPESIHKGAVADRTQRRLDAGHL